MKGIYKIENITNGKVYIGQSMDIESRWDSHKLDLENNNHHSHKLQHDYNIYGKDNFTYEVIRELEDQDKLAFATSKIVLLVYEDNYIKEFNSVENGYNCEYTLFKILSGEKSVFYGKCMSDKQITILKNIIKNIHENNGIYNPTTKRKRKTKTKVKKNKPKKIKKEKIRITGKEFIELVHTIKFKDEWQSFSATFRNIVNINTHDLFQLLIKYEMMNEDRQMIKGVTEGCFINYKYDCGGSSPKLSYKGFLKVYPIIAELIDRGELKCYQL